VSSSHNTSKWGFGMAPMSSRMRTRYDDAVQTGLDVVEGNLLFEDIDLDRISELKGMFNRCLRRDQWDWFTVHAELGRPDQKSMRQIVGALVDLRRAIKDSDAESVERYKVQLTRYSFLTCLYAYQDGFSEYSGDLDGGWIYILSTREHPDILKIGMTRRSVERRVKEINSATGVLVPFSASKVFRVTDAAVAERSIFDRLKPYRIRPDREYFRLPFKEAVTLIEGYLDAARMRQRRRGTIIWFSPEKRYGFIASEDHQDIFLHASQVRDEDRQNLDPSALVEFDIGYNPHGPFALNARLGDAS
jgi:cold shock CspA family protein